VKYENKRKEIENTQKANTNMLNELLQNKPPKSMSINVPNTTTNQRNPVRRKSKQIVDSKIEEINNFLSKKLVLDKANPNSLITKDLLDAVERNQQNDINIDKSEKADKSEKSLLTDNSKSRLTKVPKSIYSITCVNDVSENGKINIGYGITPINKVSNDKTITNNDVSVSATGVSGVGAWSGAGAVDKTKKFNKGSLEERMNRLRKK